MTTINAKRWLAAVVLSAGGLAAADASAASPAGAAEIAGGARVSPGTVSAIYAGKSWIWDHGAGYFQAEPRNFTAYLGSGEDAVAAHGRWKVSKGGRLCFEAHWVSQRKDEPSNTCFSHRRLGNVIYQRREPEGAWYALRSDPPAATDEINKIVCGDAVKAHAAKGSQ